METTLKREKFAAQAEVKLPDSVLITDQSSVSDFLREDSDVHAFSGKLGFPISRGDYLVDIAIRLEPPQ